MNLEELCTETITISKSVGNYLKEENRNFKTSSIEIKGRNDFVSYVDKKAEQKFGEALLEILPEAGFIGEEGQINVGKKEVNWIVDPLDGTTNFVHKIPFYCTSVALIKDKQLLLGVVYIPELNECFSAFKDGGAFLNAEKICVSNTTALEQSLLATGFPYTNFNFSEQYMNLFNDLMHKSRGIRRIGSAAIDLAYTACGRFDSFYEFGLNPWDVAAGSLIVKEAQGIVSDFYGGNDFINGGSIVASNTHVHENVLAATRQFF